MHFGDSFGHDQLAGGSGDDFIHTDTRGAFTQNERPVGNFQQSQVGKHAFDAGHAGQRQLLTGLVAEGDEMAAKDQSPAIAAQVTLGQRVFTGVLVGFIFRIAQDLLGPSSLVFGFSPLLAVVVPAGICALAGFFLLRRAA